jgi:Flp pilus assembly protein TadG
MSGETLTRHRERGQSLVEFALVFPIFMLMFFGVVDGARLVYTNSQLAQAAREGARVAAVEASSLGSTVLTDPSCATESEIASTRPGGHVCPVDVTALKADVVSAVGRMAVALGMNVTGPNTNTWVCVSCDSGIASGTDADPAPTGAWTEASVTYPACANDTSTSPPNAAPNGGGSLVSVRIVYTFTPITPLAGSLIGSPSLSASATMVINGLQ